MIQKTAMGLAGECQEYLEAGMMEVEGKDLASRTWSCRKVHSKSERNSIKSLSVCAEKTVQAISSNNHASRQNTQKEEQKTSLCVRAFRLGSSETLSDSASQCLILSTAGETDGDLLQLQDGLAWT